jgi:uncharacterized membrane protein YjjB (DUF3815 family)
MSLRFFANMICACVGTITFSTLFHVPKKHYISCGLVGTLGWIVCDLAARISSPAIASFCGALVVVFSARMLTVRKKCPITMFLIPGIFPLVPGARVYYTVYYLVTDQMGMAAQAGLDAIKIAFGIVIGMVFIVAIPRQVFQPIYWRKRKSRKA